MKVVLEVTFRMGGVSFRGTRWDGENLVFEFERLGDAFIQVLSDQRVEADVEKTPKKVLIELKTKEGDKVFEAFERDGRYMAAEL
ncbi:hypothetical protein TEU_04930 [Thermococcus eurythermalis]|uniref:Uncharacterized protein n=1 Tax=Thermococcus eurythermalis TaxID=1505907 RepID=A0A097QTC0_9EURY|nr:hypothetical protein [Thermococcus eurythermalis]AIU69731.1 hypothetical protein TEU_04930 [Thermococcus eurythermalis]